MIRKKIFTILTAVFMVLAFSAVTFAAQQVLMKTTIPNIPKSSCYQAGTDTMEIAADTIMQEGDVIQYTVSNRTSVCKPINMFLVISGGAAGLIQPLDDISDPTAPVTATDAADTVVSSAALLATEQWGFLIRASAGSQVITMTLRVRGAGNLLRPVVGAVTMKFTTTGSGSADPSQDKLFVKLFDGKSIAGGAFFSGFYTQAAVPVTDVYGTALTAATGPTTNILCIDTLTADYLFDDVENTYDSLPIANPAYKLTFSGDFRIAHILSSQSFNLVSCKNTVCGNIVLGLSDQGSTCSSFDYETNGIVTNGYCTTHTAGPGYVPKFILQSSQQYSLDSYSVTAQILVNGNAGAHGVYWSSTPPLFTNSATTTCGLPAGGGAFPGQTYYLADGVTPVAPAALVGSGSNNCAAVAAASKAVSFTTTAGVLFAAGDYFFTLNLPPFVYNLAEVTAGDVVSVRVTLTRNTCGSVTKDLCIGTFGCPATGTVPPAAGTVFRTCPYVTSLAANDSYWNGIAVVNTGSTAGTVNLVATKNDGVSTTTATYLTPSIPAGGMFVRLMEDIPWVGTTPLGVPAYITIQAVSGGTIPVGSVDAFVMMSDSDGGGQSMGYLCR